MRKLAVVVFVVAVLSMAALLAQEGEQEKPSEPGRIMIARRWFLVEYPCGDLKLKAWLFIPRGAENAPTAAVLRIPAGGNLFKPAVLGLGTVPEIEPYVTASFVTMVMSFRGTLDNPGRFDTSRGGLDDVLAALEFLKEQPEVDPKNVFIAGHSSAASLALRAAQSSTIPRAAAAFSPAADYSEFYKDRLAEVSEETRKYIADSSPLTHAAETKCPVLLTHGTVDDVVAVSQSERMASELKKAGKTCEFIKIPQGDHYFSMLKAGVPISVFWFSEMQRHGKKTRLFDQFRDNLLKNLENSMEPKGK